MTSLTIPETELVTLPLSALSPPADNPRRKVGDVKATAALEEGGEGPVAGPGVSGGSLVEPYPGDGGVRS